MNVFLIDDESNCTDVLNVMLGMYCPDVKVTGVFNSSEKALEALQISQPDLVFIDIEMPRLNGFDLLDRCSSLNFKVIFTTAYDQYAVRAFKFNALDYLLKPVDREELINAVQKAKQSVAPVHSQLDAARHIRQHETPERIALPVGQELWMVDVKDIEFVESEGSYVSVFIHGQVKPVVLSKSIREFEELLNNPSFFRAHNSYLVHLRHIRKIIRTEGGGIIMSNNASIPIARSKKTELMNLIAKV